MFARAPSPRFDRGPRQAGPLRTAIRALLRTAAVAALGAGSATGQSAPTAPPPEVTKAQTAYGARDYATAIATLEDFFRRNPTAVQGRLILANAYRDSGDPDRALAAYRAITRPRPIVLQAFFGAASVHAQRGAADSAMALLDSLKASGAFDMDLARTSPAFEKLRSDPRFERAMFRPADFVDPFVEKVRIIHEWVGEHRGDQFSWIARSAGDTDGDGVADVVASAPTYGATSPSDAKGRVYVYSGRTGALLWHQTGQPGDFLGIGLEAAGDVNADGIPDVVAGVPGTRTARVYSGRDGALLLTLTPPPGEPAGRSVSGAGDQNGDGHADVLVGAPGGNGAGAGAGRAFLFSGKDGTILRTFDGEKAGDGFGSIVAGVKNGSGTKLVIGAATAGPGNRGRAYVFEGADPKPKFVIDADETGAALGAMFVSVVGDIDGDRVADVYAADFTNTAKGPSTGRIYVHSGADGRRLRTLTGQGSGEGFGVGPADLGDLDRDGHDDLVIGAWQFAGAAASGGRIYVYSGRDGALLRTITGRIPGETLGFDAAGIGDVDGDGVVDLLVASSWSNIKGFQTGRMFVISGR